MLSTRLAKWALGCLVVGLTIAVVGPAAASDEAAAAADEVSLTSYTDFLDTYLFTHTGDSRGPSGADHDPARDNILQLFQSYGLTATLEPFTYSGYSGENVVAEKIGTVYPNSYYLIGAHYDSVSNPGADDNASGTALVLEAARIISQYPSDYSIRFVAFDLEELGLFGSHAYVNAHAGDDFVEVVIADMVAYDPGTDLARIYGQSWHGSLISDLGAAVDEYGDGASWFDAGWVSASDHSPFSDAGFPAVLLIESEVWNNPYYHTQQDNFEQAGNLNLPYAVKLTRSVVGWLVDAAGVQVPIDGLDISFPNGQPDFVLPAGGTTLRVEVAGVGTGVPQPGTGVLHYDIGAGWESVAMDVVSDNVYDAVFPAAACGTEVLYYVSAEAVGGEVFMSPGSAPTSSYTAVSATGTVVALADDFETDLGWSVSGDATAGMWERGTPVGGGDRGDPPTDYDGSGQCYLTQNDDDDSDVDGGTAYLVSPVIDLSAGDATVYYALWYTNDYGSDPDNDIFRIWVSSDSGSSWQLVETIGPASASGWNEHSFVVGDYVTPTALVRVRFEVSDLNSGSVVEAGIDAFEVSTLDCGPDCPGDLDGNSQVNLADLQILLSNYGTMSGAAYEDGDLDGNGTVDLADLQALLAAYGDVC